MMRFTLGFKLGFSFTFVAGLPIGGFAVLAHRVATQMRQNAVAAFFTTAREALEQQTNELVHEADALHEDLTRMALDELPECASSDCYAARLNDVRAEYAAVGHAVIRDDDGNIYYSDAEPDEHAPSRLSTHSLLSKGKGDDLLQPVFGDLVNDVLLPHSLRLPKRWAGPVHLNDDGWLLFRLPGRRAFLVRIDQAALLPKHTRSGDVELLIADDDDAFLGKAPANGESAILPLRDGSAAFVYTATSGENAFAYVPDGRPHRIVAYEPLAVLYAPVDRFLRQTRYAALLFLAIATIVAAFLSRRFLAAIARLRTGLESVGAGQELSLAKLSNDELGGGLVESVNQMSIRLAERGRREEIENWGRVIRVLSHEINNTIAPVRSVATMLNEQLQLRSSTMAGDSGFDLRQASSLIEDRITALGKFVARFGELAKLPAPERQTVDLTRLCIAAARMFTEDAAERGVTITVEKSTQEVLADVDPGQLERVVINLLKNALEASPRGGTVTVQTALAGGAAHIEVQDHGSGISAEARKSLFVPTFSTKPGGSGIGLAIVRQIVVAHHGWVVAEDVVDGGARFRVVLPQGEQDGDATPYRRRR